MEHFFIDPVNGDDTNAGTLLDPFKTVEGTRRKTLKPGNTLHLRGGHYDDRILFETPGEPGAGVISVKAFEGEVPVFFGDSGTEYLLSLKSYCHAEGITVQDSTSPTVGLCRIRGEFPQVRRCKFSNKNGGGPGMLLSGARGVLATGCDFQDIGNPDGRGGSCVVIQGETAKDNAIIGNRFRSPTMGHDAVLIRNYASNNIIKGNFFNEIAGYAVSTVEKSSRTLVENNIMRKCGIHPTAKKSAIQIASIENTVRHNLIDETTQDGIFLLGSRFSGKLQEAIGNLIYNNTVMNCGTSGLAMVQRDGARGGQVGGNLIANNIFWLNGRAWSVNLFHASPENHWTFQDGANLNQWVVNIISPPTLGSDMEFIGQQGRDNKNYKLAELIDQFPVSFDPNAKQASFQVDEHGTPLPVGTGMDITNPIWGPSDTSKIGSSGHLSTDSTIPTPIPDLPGPVPINKTFILPPSAKGWKIKEIV